MIENFDEIRKLSNSILSKVPVMETEQMQTILVKTFSIDEDVAFQILLGLQRVGDFYLSTDGWVITKSMYQIITRDRLRQHVIYDDVYRIGNIADKAKKYKPSLRLALWVMIDMIPDSLNFDVADKPWDIMFTVEPDENDPGDIAKLFQIVAIPKEKGFIIPELLNCIPHTFNQSQRYFRRIAIVEDESVANRIPKKGFSFILKYDENTPEHYVVIDDRSENESDRWLND